MRPVGLTSVTFRQLTADQIITLAEGNRLYRNRMGQRRPRARKSAGSGSQSCGSLPSKPAGGVLLWQLLQTESRS